MNKVAGFVVEICWSQSDIDHVFVEGAESREQAIKLVKKSCNCPRVHSSVAINRIMRVN